jgi:hypothetical protein
MALPSIKSETPIPHADIVQAFAQAQHLVGHTVKVTWAFDNRDRRFVWHGRILGFEAGAPAKVRVFYWKGQPGFPSLGQDVPGIELLLPRDGVFYYEVQVTAAVAVSAQDLRAAIEREDAAGNQVGPNLAMDGFLPWEVTSWLAICDPNGLGAEVVKQRIAQFAAVSSTSSHRRQDLFQSISLWIDTARGLDGWQDSESFVRLGNGIMKSMRFLIAEEQHRISTEAIHRQLARDDETDPVGVALAKLQKEKKPAFRVCDFCGKKGHTEPYCFLKRQGGKNDKGSVKKQ